MRKRNYSGLYLFVIEGDNMAFIYKIVNDINNKVYIGKTEESVEKRFKEHCQARCQSQVNSRPLYSAMNKYGVNHFRVEQIEETDSPEEREQYWIKEYDSYGSSGYNATKGGGWCALCRL